jgi:hypothetical protein
MGLSIEVAASATSRRRRMPHSLRLMSALCVPAAACSSSSLIGSMYYGISSG